MKTKLKVLSKILAMCMASSLVFAGCSGSKETGGGGSDSGKSDKITLRFFHRYPDEPYNGFINKMITEYEKTHPNIKIEASSAAYDAYREKIKVMLGSNNVPDVFFSYSGEGFLYQFARENKVLDITSDFNNDKAWKDSIIPSMLPPYSYNGKLYGFPFRVSFKMFFYNKKIFDQYSLQVPKTWDEFLKVCETLKQNNVTPISYGNSEKWPSIHYIGTLNQKVVAEDVRVKDYKPENGDFTDANYVEALKLYQKLIPYFNANPNALTHEMARTNFGNGKAAMVFLESIEVPYLAKSAPKDFQYGTFKFPDITQGKGDQTLLTGAPEGFVVSASTKHPKESIEFLKYITGPEVGKQEVKDIQWFNGAKGTIDSTADKGLVNIYNAMANAKDLANWMDNELNPQIADVYLNEVQKLTSNEITPEKLMEEVRSSAKLVKDSTKK